MHWLLAESLLKGLYLGLLLFVASRAPSGQVTAFAAGCVLTGLLAALCVAAFRKPRSGASFRGRWRAMLPYLVFASPALVYGGTLLGLAAAAVAVMEPGREGALAVSAAGGLVVGLAFRFLPTATDRRLRVGLGLLLGATLVACALALAEQCGLLEDTERRAAFGLWLFLGIPPFVLLTLAGETDEGEADVGAFCAALGLGVWFLSPPEAAHPSLTLSLATALYLAATLRVLPAIQVVKHVVRGTAYARLGRPAPALREVRRALQLDPDNGRARRTLGILHQSLNWEQLSGQPQLRALIDWDLCVERASSLLLQPSPNTEHLSEAGRLLDLLADQRPDLDPVVRYWRAVAQTHARRYDEAAAELNRVLNGSPGEAVRASVLFPAWQLALTLHPEIRQRVGLPQLAVPGRRREAIGALERHLAAQPDDAAAWDLKRVLYSNLSEADYDAGPAADRAPDFDHDYARQLGMALVNDAERWPQGAAFLRIAARGLPGQAPSTLLPVAQAQQRAGAADAALHTFDQVKRAGQLVGPKNLGEPDRQAYFAAVKALAKAARARDDLDAAIAHYHLYSDSVASGLETLRTLAELYERRGDVLAALRATEQGLLYDARDKDLLECKDRYYYSVMPADLASRRDAVRSFFDVAYCLSKSRTLIGTKSADLDVVDWAQHLAELALVMQPEGLDARVTLARALRRRGEVDAARSLLEEVYANKPVAFASGADEDAWYLACRLLAETYLYEAGRPDLAVPCLQAFRKSSKSGADTLYKLGQAYEQIGDRARAKKCYEHVVSYDRHPLAPDARDALDRMRAG
jgi:tetratricopeptide (TPR) repeat protein